MPIPDKLDARPDRIDLRDKYYTPPLRSLQPEFPSEEVIQNQGNEGACTGFGLAATINYLYQKREYFTSLTENYENPNSVKVSTRMHYHLARFYDEWPGEDYIGSSCRGAVKAWFKHGVCDAFDNDIQVIDQTIRRILNSDNILIYIEVLDY